MSQRVTISQHIVQDLHQKILNKSYKSGQRLPTERELAVLYGVSRIPVREALKTLAQQGLVEIKHGSGNYVTVIDESKLAEQICQYIFMSGGKPNDIVHLWQIMQAESAKYAADFRTDSDIALFRRLHELCVIPAEPAPAEKLEIFFEADKQFHVAIAKLCDNSLLIHFIKIFHDILQFNDAAIRQNMQGICAMFEKHADLLLAIERQDKEAAAKAVNDEFAIGRHIFTTAMQVLPLHEVFSKYFFGFTKGPH